MDKRNTSWGQAAEWYNALLEERQDTCQRTLILPNTLRLLGLKRGEAVLDLGCGQGFFSREFFKAGARVTGVDCACEMIELAKRVSPKEITYHIASGEDMPFLRPGSLDAVVIILALQNILKAREALKECGRVLRPYGQLLIVLNHPAFRVPQASEWWYDSARDIQYRRIDQYLSESKVKIQTHPGDCPADYTLSFHRPLQYYVKALRNAGFVLTRLEEWNSNKQSAPGKRAVAENRARKEIPLFLCLVAEKI